MDKPDYVSILIAKFPAFDPQWDQDALAAAWPTATEESDA